MWRCNQILQLEGALLGEHVLDTPWTMDWSSLRAVVGRNQYHAAGASYSHDKGCQYNYCNNLLYLLYTQCSRQNTNTKYKSAVNLLHLLVRLGLLGEILNHVVSYATQVQRRDGEWIDAIPIPDTVLINIADLLQRWSSDKLISTVRWRISVALRLLRRDALNYKIL